MRDRVFINTNIIIYSFSEDESRKQQIALSIIEDMESIISTQVLNELSNVFFKKFKLSADKVEDAILELDSLLDVVSFDVSTQIKALRLKKRYNFGYYDSLIVATALENKCSILYSEDMQHELLVDQRLKIINPFK